MSLCSLSPKNFAWVDGIDLTIQEVRQEQKAQREKIESLEAAVQLIQPSLKKYGGMLQVLKDSSTTAEVFFGQIRATVVPNRLLPPEQCQKASVWKQ